MRLKTFQGANVTEAMREAMAALGDEAVIVDTIENDDGSYTVTAAIDKPGLALDEGPVEIEDEDESQTETAPSSEPLADDQYKSLNRAMDRLIDGLYKHGIPAAITDRIIARCELASDNSPQVMLTNVLDTLLHFDDLPAKRPLFLLGQPGSGKTLTAAKLAARVVMRSGVKPTMITCDTLRAGGIAQLEAITDILEIPLQTAESGAELTEVLGDGPTIVDLPGVNAFDPQQMKHAAEFLKASPEALPVLVLPAGLDAYESAEIARAFAILGAKHMLITRMDVARRFGGVLAAADQTGMALTLMSDTPQIAEGLTPLSAQRLARAVLPPRGIEERTE